MYKVTVIIPAYNSSRTLGRAIESVLKQTYQNIEVIVVDDGSVDNTYEVAASYISDKLKVYKQQNSGACKARNLGISKATGYYVKFLDSDDYLLSNAVYEQVKQAELLEEKQVVYGYRKMLFKTTGVCKTIIKPLLNQPVDLISDNLTISLPLHKLSSLLELNGFDEELSFRQEWDLHLRLSDKGYEFVYFESCVFVQVIHDSEVRISSRKLEFKKEFDNLEKIFNKFTCMTSAQYAAWAYKYWTLGRQFLKLKKTNEAKLFFDKAKEISPKGYMLNFPIAYRLMVKVLGVRISEKIITLSKL